ncbi:hypothetical protein N7465_003802 [Penicillium sp. CMV-2018d]|nr:hypothetical protein N7465_003802 [Penicillium sp. CMV-2018d]
MQVVQSIREAIFYYSIDKNKNTHWTYSPMKISTVFHCPIPDFFMVLERQRKKFRLPIGIDKIPILCRLEHGLPDYFVCYYCFVLHKFDRSQ